MDYSILRKQRRMQRLAERGRIDAERRAHIENQTSQKPKPPGHYVKNPEINNQDKPKAPDKPKPKVTLSKVVSEDLPKQPPFIRDADGKPQVPTNWRELTWPYLRDLAQALVGGRELTSRAEARAVVAAHAPKE